MIVVGLVQDEIIFDKLQNIDQQYNLQLNLEWKTLAKTNQATLINFAAEGRAFLGIIKNIPMLLFCSSDNNYQNYDLIKTYPNWEALTRRIVTAGRKSELLLQASKLTQEKTAIDATAGFGHDSLILASTGASVAMIEQNPVMFLLLQYELRKMQVNPNWQKLLARLRLFYGNANDILPTLSKVDVIYLDPMFPDNSYKSAQVGKQMQILHTLASPPTLAQETQLLKMAQRQLNPNGRVIVKRPKSAPFLANSPPQESWSNEVIRYDGYFG